MTSIRQRLVINLLIAVFTIITLTAVSIYYISNTDIEVHIDAELISSSLVFQSVLGNSINDSDSLKIIQKSLDEIPKQHRKIFAQYQSLSTTDRNSTYDSAFQYQVWDANGNLLLRSSEASTVPMSNGTPGFSNTYVNNQAWRVFTYKNPVNNISIIVAENFSQQRILKNALATNNLIIMLITLPLLGLLIWLIVNQNLVKIKNIADEISQREPAYLEPVNIEKVPLEIQPLIDELNRLFVRLHEAFQREQRFAADAAHELRTPMAAIKIQSQVALSSHEQTEIDIALHKILSGVDRSTHVVQQLLTLSRLSPGSAMDQHKAVNLVAIVTEIISDLAPLAIESNIEIELISEKDNITMLGNAASLGILVRNLLDNAIRYSHENGKVKIEVEQGKNTVVLRVSDNGPGIPEKLYARVFERFFRVLGTQKPGSGLGLAIVQQISNLHHAQLKLSKPPEGTGLVVEITFPNRFKERVE